MFILLLIHLFIFYQQFIEIEDIFKCIFFFNCVAGKSILRNQSTATGDHFILGK